MVFQRLQKEDPFSRNIPKVVLNKFNELIYISRAVVPSSKNKKDKIKYLKQVCIYAFNKRELYKFMNYKEREK